MQALFALPPRKKFMSNTPRALAGLDSGFPRGKGQKPRPEFEKNKRDDDDTKKAQRIVGLEPATTF